MSLIPPLQEPWQLDKWAKLVSQAWVTFFKAICTFINNLFSGTNVWTGTNSWSGSSTFTGTTRFGTDPNYAEFEADGTLANYGNATTWDDLRVEPVVRAAGTDNPNREKWFDSSGLNNTTAGTQDLQLYSFDDLGATAATEKAVRFTVQMPHAWDGSAIYPHVHWVGNINQNTATPRWGLQYNWAGIGGDFGASTIVYNSGQKIGAGGATDANITAARHYITPLTPLTPTGTQSGISAILICRLFRNNTSASDTYTTSGNKCGLLYIDFHYRSNTLGSREEFVK